MRLLDRLLGREKRQDAARDDAGGGMPLAEPGAWVFGEDDEDAPGWYERGGLLP